MNFKSDQNELLVPHCKEWDIRQTSHNASKKANEAVYILFTVAPQYYGDICCCSESTVRLKVKRETKVTEGEEVMQTRLNLRAYVYHLVYWYQCRHGKSFGQRCPKITPPPFQCSAPPSEVMSRQMPSALASDFGRYGRAVPEAAR